MARKKKEDKSLLEKTKELVTEVKNTVAEVVEEIQDTAVEVVEEIQDTTVEVIDEVGDIFQDNSNEYTIYREGDFWCVNKSGRQIFRNSSRENAVKFITERLRED